MLVLGLTLFSLAFSICPFPQKSLHSSLPALAATDSLEKLFASLQLLIPRMSFAPYQVNVTSTYFFYNRAYQQNRPEGDNIFVQLGTVEVVVNFNYTGKQTKGVAAARSSLDPNNFLKKLNLIDGSWGILTAQEFTFTSLFVLQQNIPQTEIFYKLINGQSGAGDLRDNILMELNPKYREALSKMLSEEKDFAGVNFSYSYNSYKIDIANSINSSICTERGLQVNYLFGADSSCADLPSLALSGHEEVYTFAAIKGLLPKAFFNRTIDKSWDVAVFQFRMGDLANAVVCEGYVPTAAFSLKCAFATEPTLGAYSNSQLYIEVMEKCAGQDQKEKQLFTLSLRVGFIVRMTAMEKMRVVVERVQVRGVVFEAGVCKLASQSLLQYYVESVLNGTVGLKTFGDGFPLAFNQRPSLFLTAEYLAVFDAAQ